MTLCRLLVNILFIATTQVYGTEEAIVVHTIDEQDFMDKLVDNLVDKLLPRKAWPLQHSHHSPFLLPRSPHLAPRSIQSNAFQTMYENPVTITPRDEEKVAEKAAAKTKLLGSYFGEERQSNQPVVEYPLAVWRQQLAEELSSLADHHQPFAEDFPRSPAKARSEEEATKVADDGALRVSQSKPTKVAQMHSLPFVEEKLAKVTGYASSSVSRSEATKGAETPSLTGQRRAYQPFVGDHSERIFSRSAAIADSKEKTTKVAGSGSIKVAGSGSIGVSRKTAMNSAFPSQRHPYQPFVGHSLESLLHSGAKADAGEDDLALHSTSGSLSLPQRKATTVAAASAARLPPPVPLSELPDMLKEGAVAAGQSVSSVAAGVVAFAKAVAKTKAAEVVSKYSLIASGTNLKHPNKALSEDAWFAEASKRGGGVIAVADGVGGYSLNGVDAGLYARVLSYEVREARQSNSGLKDVIAAAQRKTKVPGAATLCMVEVNGTKLHAANVGDSGFRVVRDGEVVFASSSQQHDFNVPYQLAYKDLAPNADTADSAQVFDFPVQPGDLVVAASDGLFDNVFDGDIARVATEAAMNEHTTLTATKAASEALVNLARENAENAEYESPFARELTQRSKVNQRGGKLDDITVVVGKIVSTADHANDLKEAVAASDQLAQSMEEERKKAWQLEAKTALSISLKDAWQGFKKNAAVGWAKYQASLQTHWDRNLSPLQRSSSSGSLKKRLGQSDGQSSSPSLSRSQSFWTALLHTNDV